MHTDVQLSWVPQSEQPPISAARIQASRSTPPSRFVCRQQLGGRKGEPAAYLTPVPPGAVIYGSGESQRILTKASSKRH